MSFQEFLKDENGNSAVTLAMCSIPFIFIFAMVISFGQAMYGVQVAANASAAGARAAAISGTASSGYQAAGKVSKDYVGRAGMGVSFSSDNLVYTTWKRKNLMEYYVTVKVNTAMPMQISPASNGIKSEYIVTRSCPAMIEGG